MRLLLLLLLLLLRRSVVLPKIAEEARIRAKSRFIRANYAKTGPNQFLRLKTGFSRPNFGAKFNLTSFKISVICRIGPRIVKISPPCYKLSQY